MRALPFLAAAGLAAAPAAAGAAELSVTPEIPRLSVAEYHRPCVAIWVERPDQRAAATLAVWYDLGMRSNEGEKRPKDIRHETTRSSTMAAMTGRSTEGPSAASSGTCSGPRARSSALRRSRSPLPGASTFHGFVAGPAGAPLAPAGPWGGACHRAARPGG